MAISWVQSEGEAGLGGRSLPLLWSWSNVQPLLQKPQGQHDSWKPLGPKKPRLDNEELLQQLLERFGGILDKARERPWVEAAVFPIRRLPKQGAKQEASWPDRRSSGCIWET